MATYDAQSAANMVADPQTPAQALADIAAQHPALWDRMRQHPNMYPGLLGWIDQMQGQQAPSAEAAAAQAQQTVQPQQPAQFGQSQPEPQQSQSTYAAQPFPAPSQQQAYTEQPVPSQPLQAGYAAPQGFPGAQPGYGQPAYEQAQYQQAPYGQAAYGRPAPKKRKTGMIIGIVAASALVLSGAGVGTAFMLGAFGGSGGGGSLQDGLKLVSAPSGEFTMNLMDTRNIEAAIGEPFPKNGSENDYYDWIDLGYSGSTQLIATEAARVPFELATTVFSSDGLIQLSDRRGSESATAFIGDLSESLLNDQFGEARSGIWEVETDDGLYSITRIDGATYFTWGSAGDLPSARPAADGSMASDESVSQILALLAKSNGYAYTIERDDVPSDNALENTGNRLDDIITYGSSLALRDGKPFVTLAYDFGSSGTAEANLRAMEEAFEASADGLDVDEPVRVYTEGRFVVAEYDLSDTSRSLMSVTFDLRNLYNW